MKIKLFKNFTSVQLIAMIYSYVLRFSLYVFVHPSVCPSACPRNQEHKICSFNKKLLNVATIYLALALALSPADELIRFWRSGSKSQQGQMSPTDFLLQLPSCFKLNSKDGSGPQIGKKKVLRHANGIKFYLFNFIFILSSKNIYR